MEENRLYYKFSEYLKNKYGTKVYKLPINLPVTCPNRDGKLGIKGCAFCGEEGAGFENLPSSFSVSRQIELNSRYIGDNYKSQKFIAYFQNYSNTYLPFGKFKEYISDACVPKVVALYISTRPDCINDNYLAFLEELKNGRQVDVVLELGLQTVNYKTLNMLDRGHTLAEFIDAAIRIRRHGLECCAHYILDLPMDSMEDVEEGAKILSALEISQVKCHSMYILENTKFAELYLEGQLKPIPLDEYFERAAAFLEHLNPEIVVQRLLGRAPEERTLFCNWGMSWWKIRDLLEEKMIKEGRYQGRRFDYLGGKAIRRM